MKVIEKHDGWEDIRIQYDCGCCIRIEQNNKYTGGDNRVIFDESKTKEVIEAIADRAGLRVTVWKPLKTPLRGVRKRGS